MNSITRALNDVARSRERAKQAVADRGVRDLVAGPAGGIRRRPNLGEHRHQYSHNKGWQYVCVRAIAQRFAGQQLFVGNMRSTRPRLSRDKAFELKRSLPTYMKAHGDNIEPLESHELLDTLANPNALMVSWVLSYVMIASLELTGKSYLWLRETDDGINIWPLPSHWVEADHKAGLFSKWLVRPSGTADAFPLEAQEVAPIVLPDPGDPLFGSISPLQSQAAAINADESIQTAQAKAFANGIFPGHVIRVGGLPGPDGIVRKGQNVPELTNRQHKQLVSALQKRYGNTTNAGEPFIVDALIESIEPLSMKPAEMDFLDSGMQTKSRIMQAFGVNPIIVGEIQNANRAAAHVAEESFCTNVINPLLTLVGQVLTARVAPLFAGVNEQLVAWYEPCRARDPELQLKRWQTAAKHGLSTVNEYRVHVLNLPEVPWGDIPISAVDGMADMIDQRVNDAMGATAAGELFSRNGHAKEATRW